MRSSRCIISRGQESKTEILDYMRPLREEQQDLRKAPETANLTRHRAYLTWRHVLAAYGFTLIVLSAERYVNSAYSTTPLISSIRVCFAQLILIAAAAGLSLKCRGCFAIGSPVTAFRSHPLLLGVASLVAAVRGVPHIAALQVYWGSFSIVASKLSASVILVPLAEEWIFRGVIQTALRRSLPGFWWLGFRL
jgi:membrane protease YdiL (CAAX protease family)